MYKNKKKEKENKQENMHNRKIFIVEFKYKGPKKREM